MIGLGCCCGSCPDLTADEWINVTKVDDYASSPNPDGIDPYARPWYELNTTGCILASASPASCGEPDLPVCYNRGFDGELLAKREEISGIKACSGSGIVDQAINNCYQKTGNTVTFHRDGPRCGMGWKGVQALAHWPGRFGFVNSGADCCPDGGQEQSKYAAVNYSNIAILTTETEFNPLYPGGPYTETTSYSHDFRQLSEVDLNGNISRSGQKRSAKSRFNSASPGDDYDLQDNCDGSYAVGAGTSFDGEDDGDGMYSASVFEGTKDFPWLCDVGTPPTEPVKPSDGTYDGSNWDNEVTVSGWEYEFSVTDSKIHYKWAGVYTVVGRSNGSDETNYGPAGTEVYNHVVTWSQEIIIELTGERLFSDVVQDCKDLLSEWPLNDDKVYPWRTDAKTWLQPFITRDAGSVQPTINWAVDEDCEFIQEQQYTGNIIGAPLPAGYDRYFNFTHVNWVRGLTDGGTVCACCEESLGAESPTEIPKTATKWTENEFGSSMTGPGARMTQRIDYNYCSGSIGAAPLDGVFMQKWAETLEDWPKQNAARPCGRDRWLIDETDDACVESFDGTNLIISGTTEFTVGDLIGMSGGVFQVMTKTDATTYTVGDGTTEGVVKYTPPASITYTDVAALRYPTAPAICGQLNVTTATQAAEDDPVAITTSKKHWLRNGDTVNFTIITGLSTGHVVTVVDETSFTVPFTGEFTPYTGGGKVTQSDSDIANDSTCSTHTYFTREWSSAYREAAEDPEEPSYGLTETEREFEFAGKKSFVVCISPNSDDVFEHGLKFDFPTDFEADTCYGREWIMDVLQAIPDPYWQEKKLPCGGGAWEMDSAPCAGDGQYPHYPLVEPTASGAAMPSAVGAAWCESEPRSRATVHNIRAAWLECDEWPEMINANCGSRGF